MPSFITCKIGPDPALPRGSYNAVAESLRNLEIKVFHFFQSVLSWFHPNFLMLFYGMGASQKSKGALPQH